MDFALQAEMAKPVWIRALLLRIDAPSGTYCFTDGGFVTYDGQTYYGRHPVIGSWNADNTSIRSGTGNQTTRVDLDFNPIDDVSITTLSSVLSQGSRVRIWRGAVDFETGLLIGAPRERFDGELAKPSHSFADGLNFRLECGTQSARQLRASENQRLNSAMLKAAFPGALGLDNNSDVVRNSRSQVWRSD